MLIRNVCRLVSQSLLLAAITGSVASVAAQETRSGQGSPANDVRRDYPVGGKRLTLENAAVRIAFDAKTGALIEFTNKRTGWAFEGDNAAAGRSFEMFVPLPDRSYSPVLGVRNALASYQLSLDKTELTLVWKGLASEYAGTLDITFTGHVLLTQDGVRFESRVENRSPYTVETISWPILGQLTPPAGEETLTREKQSYDSLQRTSLLPEFANEKGYWGVNYPTQMVDTRFVLVAAKTQGLYFGKHDTRPDDAISREMVEYRFALQPGYADSYRSRSGSEAKLGTLPARLTAGAIHYPFALAGETATLAPVVIAPYEGDWHAGIDVYKRWRATWFKRPTMPAWTEQIHAWQQIQINGSEDDLRTKYRDLFVRAEQAAKAGVTAIQLVGWNRGGQDRGNPSHDTDPRLGTQAELKEVIGRIQSELGVHVVLFNKFTWADVTTDEYKRDLNKHVAVDPFGIAYQFAGYQYQTPTQLANLNTRRFAPACMLDPAWLDLSLREFQKSLDLGASGILFDEVAWHGGTSYCFSKEHGHHVPAYIFGGDALLGQRLRDRVRATVGERKFLLSGEEVTDIEQLYYSLAYFRIGSGHIPVVRYTDPYLPMVVAVAGFDDRETINHALMDRYLLSYEPFNFKGDLNDMPLSVAYGTKADTLRRRYHEFLWDAEFHDTQDASVTSPSGVKVEYATFRTSKGGHAIVIVNDDATKPLKVQVVVGSPGAPLTYATPEDQERRPLTNLLTLPPRSAAVVFQDETLPLKRPEVK